MLCSCGNSQHVGCGGSHHKLASNCMQGCGDADSYAVPHYLCCLHVWPCLQVLPQQHGQTLPPWFPLMPSYWRAGKSSSQPHSSTQDEAWQPLLDRAGGAAPAGATVQVRDLRKVFHSSEGSVRMAVEGLTLDMCAGRITALLGHNGAGKVGLLLSCEMLMCGDDARSSKHSFACRCLGRLSCAEPYRKCVHWS